MQLPPALRQATERALDGVSLESLAATAAELSRRYREERRDGKLHVSRPAEALAYIAVRMPATYAAIRASLGAAADARPDFAPKTVLDIGAGPGTALWAAVDCWPSLIDALLIEASPAFRACGEALAADAHLPRTVWRTTDIAVKAINETPRDLVTLGYVLNELAPEARPAAIEALWNATAGMLVIVEPGTPAGWRRILDARRQLVAAGAHVVAPCPHAYECPLQPPDWCHFAERVDRSRLHRQAKSAVVPWEDEKFSYLALSRKPASMTGSRVIAPPQKSSGRVTLKLCRSDGSAGNQLFSRRDGEAYRRASRTGWGDAL